MTDRNQEKELIKETIKEILQAMGVDAQLDEEKLENIEGGEIFTVNLKMDDPSILIGQSGNNLQALQYIVKLLAYQKIKNFKLEDAKTDESNDSKMLRINLDINDYKKQRADSLQEMARGMADQVLYSESSVVLRPMSAYERRIVHMEIAKRPELITESLGEEPFRKIIIKVK